MRVIVKLAMSGDQLQVNQIMCAVAFRFGLCVQFLSDLIMELHERYGWVKVEKIRVFRIRLLCRRLCNSPFRQHRQFQYDLFSI